MAEDRQFVTALDRGLRILQAVSRVPGGLTNGELAEQTGLPRSSISRLVHTLRATGYLALDPVSRRYCLKPKVLTLGYSILNEATLLERARPALQEVAERSGETVALAVRDGLHATFLEVARGRNMLAVQMAVGARLPLGSSASGLALLKVLPEAERRQVAARLRAGMTRNGIGHGTFDQRLAAALSEDVVIVRDAWHRGIGGVAVPVRYGAETGTLCLAVSTAAVSEAAMRHKLAPCLLEAVRSRQLDHVDA